MSVYSFKKLENTEEHHILGIRKILLIQDFPKPESQIDGCVDRAWLAQALDGPDNCLDGHAVIDR